MHSKSFYDRLNEVAQEARDLIINSIQEGQILHIITPEDESNDDDNERFNNDVFNDCVSVMLSDKYGNIGEYGIVSLEKKNNIIILHGSRKEDLCDKKDDFSLGTIEQSAICVLADQIEELLLNQKA